jgi:hypothetical protein
MMIGLVKFLLRCIGFFMGDKYKYPQEYEDNYQYMGISEKIRWVYKYFIKQIETGQKGRKLEEYFAGQDLNFAPAGFSEEESVILTAGGDLLTSVHIRPENTVNLWDDIQDFYFNSDIACANLETPVVPGRQLDYIRNVFKTASFNTTPEMFEVYAKNGKGINFFSTANNHSLDQGTEGLLATLDFLDNRGCGHCGTSRTAEEQMNVPVIQKNNIKIAFLSYTYALNGKELPVDKGFMVNYIRLNKPDTDLSLVREQAAAAREKGADIIVACLHWSLEFESYPTQTIITMGHRIMECGIDIILGNHAHVLQTMEKYHFTDPISQKEKEGFIAYALGDLVSCQGEVLNSKLSCVMKLKISKGLQNGVKTTLITDLKIKPIYLLSKMQQGRCLDFRILDFIKLARKVKSGLNLHRLDKIEIKELERLEGLLLKLLPEKHDDMLV